MTRYRVGVDIGGTFTDIVFLSEHGARLTRKVSSTVDNYATAIVGGLADLIGEHNLGAPEIVELLHGTTVASNAILELKGARTGLITTKGFRDVLEIRTLRMPRLYDLSWTKPPPLVERHLRVEVDEAHQRQGRGRAAAQRGRCRAGDRETGRSRGRGDRRLPHSLLPEPGTRAAGQGGRRQDCAQGDFLHQRQGLARDQGI
jgi:N-methylhydantoinase A/oxoprolinase/acetone carboxylase beta subunit